MGPTSQVAGKDGRCLTDKGNPRTGTTTGGIGSKKKKPQNQPGQGERKKKKNRPECNGMDEGLKRFKIQKTG